MALLDWLFGGKACPRCGTRGAKVINGSIHCPNPTCAYFSKTMGIGGEAAGPITFGPPPEVPEGSIAIQYRNFRGQGKTFVAQTDSARRVRNHISVELAEGRKRKVTRRNPATGEPMTMLSRPRIVLSRDRINNLAEVENSFPQQVAPGQDWPTPRERQVLSYHKKRGTSSPLYASIRSKYPNW